MDPSSLAIETARRRTFAIISHPDAGKTTLTEKLLLYGGAIQVAGAVAAGRNRRVATSDWMELEKQRGISVTSTVLQFPYRGHILNLLDTPGHQDFSEDTYRTLIAADSALMLIDNAKGVEPQTRKLFHVCRQRQIPIFTLINKMDRPGKEPLELMEELESVLGIRSSPVVWPIGDGDRFRGVYDRLSGRLHLFDRTEHGASRAPVDARDLDDPAVESLLGVRETERLREERELLEIAGDPLDIERVARGELTPLFFGSAVTNFGIELLLDHFLALSPPPGPRLSTEGEIAPSHDRFSGFVFKIQANMDPKHRDRIAFLRVVSGVFQRDMSATNVRTQKSVRLSSPQKLFGAEREIVELAYPGDIIGLTNPGLFQLGDTIAAMPSRFAFKGFPRFACEHFGVLRNKKTEKYKQFQKGVQQLAEEGVVQLFFDPMAGRTEPTLGVVGQLQFEVIQFRLLHEYGVETVLDRLPFTSVRWIEGSEAAISQAYWSSGTRRVEDDRGRLACLFESDWSCNYFADKHPDLTLKETATGDR